MIDRYIYAVTRELPKKNREEVSSQLNVLIDDKMAAMDSAFSEKEKEEKVLRELGDPRELANRYRGKERYLIGPRYYDNFIFVLKIVVLSVFIGISIASGLGVLFSGESFTEIIVGYIGTLFSAVLQGAAWVTGIFALLEYFEISVETGKKYEAWSPSQLPELPNRKAIISRGESVFSIIIATIFLSLFFFLSEKIGIYYNLAGDIEFIPLFNMEEMAPFKSIIFLVFLINILIELIKIIKGKWTLKMALSITVLNVISSVLFINIINNRNIWNQEMVQRFEQYLPITFKSMIFLTILVVIIITIGESISAIYKAIKYGGE